MSDESIIIPIIISAQSAVNQIKDLGKEAEKTTATFKSFSTTSSAAMQTFTVQAKAAATSMTSFSKNTAAGFSDFIGKAKTAQASMSNISGAGAAAANSMKGFGASILSVLSPTSLLIGAATSLVAGLLNAVFANNKLASSTKILSDIQHKATESTKDEAIQLQILFAVAKDTANSYDVRKAAIDKLNKAYPELHKNITLENIGTRETAAAIQSVINKMVQKAQLQGLVTMIAQLSNARDAFKELSDGMNKGFIKNAILNKIDQFDKRINTLTESAIKLQGLTLDSPGNNGLENLGKGIGDMAKEVKVEKITAKPNKVVVEKPRDLSFAADFNFADALFKTIKMPHGAEAPVVKIPVSFEAGDAGNKGGQIGEIIKPQLTAAEKEVQEFTDKINESIQNIAIEGISNIAEDLGKALGGDSANNLFKNFANVLATGLVTLGKMVIKSSVIIKALKETLEKSLNPYVMLAAGIGLVVVGSALKASLGHGVKGFAQGGLVSGSVFGNVGEGMGTHAGNPEVIMPLDKLKGFFRNMVGANMGYSASGRMGTAGYSLALPQRVELFASGRTLNGVLTLEQISQKRTG